MSTSRTDPAHSQSAERGKRLAAHCFAVTPMRAFASAMFDLVRDRVLDDMGGNATWGGLLAGSGCLALVRCAIFCLTGVLGTISGTLGSTYGSGNIKSGEINGCCGFFLE